MKIISGTISQRTDTKKWILRYYIEPGKRREKTFEKQKDAKCFLSDHIQKRPVRQSSGHSMSSLCKEFISACITGRDGNLPLRNDTIRSYRAHLNKWTLPYFRGRSISDITVTDMRMFQAHILSQAKTRTSAQRCFTITKTILKYAVEHEYIPSNPGQGLTIKLRSGRDDPDLRVKVFTTKQMKDIYKEARILAQSNEWNVHRAWKQYYPLLLCLCFLGLRSSEAFGLMFEDFNDDMSSVTIKRRIETPKVGMSSVDDRIAPPKSRNGVRKLPIPKHLSELLRSLRSDRGKNVGFVFETQTGQPLNYHNVVRGMWKPLLSKADVPELGMHALRHTYASILLQKGYLHEVSKMLGHSSATFTMDVYGHLLEDNEFRLNEIADDVASNMIFPPD